MKHLIIAAVLGILVAYCIGVTKHHGMVPVPHYKEITLNIKGKSDAGWAKHPTAARERLRDLSRERYLLPPADGDLKKVDFEHPLTEENYEKIIKDDPEGARKFKLLDQSAVLALAEKHLRFKEKTVANGVTYPEDAPLNRAAIENVMRDGKIAELPVSGTGETIAVQPGTMLMIVLIFVALLCALKIILYDPLLKIMDERETEITEGTAHQRENIQTAQALENRRKELRERMRQEHLAELAESRRSAQTVADGMLKEARVEAHRAHDNNMQEMADVVKDVRSQLQAATPELADRIVEQVLGLPAGDKS